MHYKPSKAMLNKRNTANKLKRHGKTIREIMQIMGYNSTSAVAYILSEKKTIKNTDIMDMTEEKKLIKQNIKDYLHLYLGCEVVSGKHNTRLYGIVNNQAVIGLQRFPYTQQVSFDEVKLILRPLSDMTDEERREWLDFRLIDRIEPEKALQLSEALRTKYLFSKYFDLFGLIDAGLAIDKTQQLNQLKQ